MKNSRFQKTERTDPLTGASIQTFIHPDGLVLHYIPKPKFSKKFAGFLVPYGSIHNRFKTPDGKEETVPAGTAHYLEHCIFSKEEEGGLLNRLSSLGANANAYTSHTHTMYYFTTVDHFTEAFELYFKAVINPYLEQDRVDSERNIIIQELEMYEDDPDNQCFSNLIESLYLQHPVRIDIGGTKESVREITPEHLKRVRESFYAPGALTVTVSGDFDIEEILEALSCHIPAENTSLSESLENGTKRQTAVQNKEESVFLYENEPQRVKTSTITYEMDVSVQSFLIGIKNPAVSAINPIRGYEKVCCQKSGQLFFEMILGSSSEIFEKLYSEGILNDSFGFHYVCEDTYSYMAMGGESPDPRLAAEKLYSMLLEQFEKTLDPEDFELQKRVVAGNFVHSLDSVEHGAMTAAIADLSGVNIFDYPEIYDKMELTSTMESMRFVCDKSQKTDSFLMKKQVEA